MFDYVCFPLEIKFALGTGRKISCTWLVPIMCCQQLWSRCTRSPTGKHARPLEGSCPVSRVIWRISNPESLDMDVSENRGFSPQIIHGLIGFSIISHSFWGTPIFWKHPYIGRLVSILLVGRLFCGNPVKDYIKSGMVFLNAKSLKGTLIHFYGSQLWTLWLLCSSYVLDDFDSCWAKNPKSALNPGTDIAWTWLYIYIWYVIVKMIWGEISK